MFAITNAQFCHNLKQVFPPSVMREKTAVTLVHFLPHSNCFYNFIHLLLLAKKLHVFHVELQGFPSSALLEITTRSQHTAFDYFAICSEHVQQALIKSKQNPDFSMTSIEGTFRLVC